MRDFTIPVQEIVVGGFMAHSDCSLLHVMSYLFQTEACCMYRITRSSELKRRETKSSACNRKVGKCMSPGSFFKTQAVKMCQTHMAGNSVYG